jgi:RimJ/RimL family protein N-acetyltransferase
MTEQNLLTGEKVALVVVEPDKDAALLSKWATSSEFLRLLDADPVRMFSPASTQKWLEEQVGDKPGAGLPEMILFMIRDLAEDKVIGFVDLSGFDPPNDNAWVGIGLGERETWGQGYGTEAMELLLRYAFVQLSLHRVSLSVFAYNPRAVRSYEKVGFQLEGTLRGALNRDGRRWDMLLMGILRQEWEVLQGLTS